MLPVRESCEQKDIQQDKVVNQMTVSDAAEYRNAGQYHKDCQQHQTDL
jgi:hypothetical protein